MHWIIFFAFAVAVLLAAVLFLIFRSKIKSLRAIKSFYALALAVFLSAFLLFLPVFDKSTTGGAVGVLKTLFLSFHQVVCLFLADADYDIVSDIIRVEHEQLAPYYLALVSVLFAVAPMLTFGFVLSFFKNISAYIKYYLLFGREVYVFSEINERSVALALDIKKNHPKCVLVYTDVYETGEESQSELIAALEEQSAIFFKKDITGVNFTAFGKRKKLSFFVMGKDSAENINHALGLISKYKNRENTELYVFSSDVSSSLILSSSEKMKLKLRRVDETLSLINRQLYDTGHIIFDGAIERVGEAEKHIGAVIVGMKGYGSEMIKALSWYCQMDGYEIEIDAFDADPKAKSKLVAECPELLDDRHNGVSLDGEASYKINVHSGVFTGSTEFAEKIKALSDTTYVLVSLGSDERNVSTAIDLRALFLQIGKKPRIQAIVYNSGLKESLKEAKNFRNESYDIDFIGDIYESYTEAVIIDSELEADALGRHKKYGSEEDFWKHEYNYRSSVASAIHMKARIYCGIPGADKKEEELTTIERDIIENLEHRRWNAYMRGIGYIYSGSTEKSSRNDVARMHNDLTAFGSLSDEDKRKDSKVGTN